MTTVNQIDGKTVVITKGAYDMLTTRCVSGDFAKAGEMVSKMSSDSLRVLAVAYKVIDTLPENYSFEDAENGLTFMGLVGMIDPPRPEAKEAVALCKRAGIKAVMITGDHIDTAKAIARELGILNEGELAITGAQLDQMSEEELIEKIASISVYARVSPENKIRIVKAWQAHGEVVAMTGDGVNDAPALKAADIGCAMGITGTDVAKGSADMTLTDDNFSTLVHAVKEGRGIYDNIKKVVGFLLGTNIAEILIVFLAMMIFHLSPFISIQLLWINLVTDSLPAIALGMERVDDDCMSRKPRKKTEGLFSHGYGLEIILHGIVIGALVLICYIIGYKVFDSEMVGSTMAFLSLALCEIVQSYNMRTEKSLFTHNPFANKTLNWACLLSLIMVVAVVCIPGLNGAFNTCFMKWWCYLVVAGAGLLVIAYMEIFKFIKNKINK
jgi:Ca2+-transporting ATPase